MHNWDKIQNGFELLLSYQTCRACHLGGWEVEEGEVAIGLIMECVMIQLIECSFADHGAYILEVYISCLSLGSHVGRNIAAWITWWKSLEIRIASKICKCDSETQSLVQAQITNIELRSHDKHCGKAKS